MEHRKFRLVTRSDFDGLVCAVLAMRPFWICAARTRSGLSTAS
jgi:hypothetical protein